MENREMFAELNWLLGALATALEISEEQAARAVEAGEMTLNLGKDERGQKFVAATYLGKTVQVYQGAVRHHPER